MRRIALPDDGTLRRELLAMAMLQKPLDRELVGRVQGLCGIHNNYPLRISPVFERRRGEITISVVLSIIL